MKKESGFTILEKEYSKKLSECQNGEIVEQKDTRLLLVKAPELSEKEQKLFERVLEELKRTEKEIKTKADVYFFLKDYR